MVHKLNEIQAIGRTVKEAPKIYADIIKTKTINTKEKAIAEMRARASTRHSVKR